MMKTLSVLAFVAGVGLMSLPARAMPVSGAPQVQTGDSAVIQAGWHHHWRGHRGWHRHHRHW
jgi:hypothetical protein